MLITRGESVQRNTSAEGVSAVRKQIQDLKDSWDAFLSTSIQCKRLVLCWHYSTGLVQHILTMPYSDGLTVGEN